MDASELARSRAIEDENSRMQRIISNLTLENDAMKQLMKKTSGALAAKRSGEGLARTRIEPTRSVPHNSLRQIGRAIHGNAC